MPFTQTTAVPVYFETKAPADPAGTIVFAHGAGGNAGIWFNQLAYFAARYRVIAFDHRGFARTPLPDGALRVQHFRDDVLALLDEHDVERAHLVGQSMGGFTALRTTLDAPDRVQSLTLSATTGGIHNPNPTEAARNLTKSEGRNAGGVLQTMAAATARRPALMQLYESINCFNTKFSWANLAHLLSAEDVVAWETLADVQPSTLIIAGAEDPLFPAEMLATLVPHFKQARIEIVQDSGHSPYFEQPETFNQLLEAHVESCA